MKPQKQRELRDAIVSLGLPETLSQPRKGWFNCKSVTVSQYRTGEIVVWAEYETGRGWWNEDPKNQTEERTVFAMPRIDGTLERLSIEEIERRTPDELSEVKFRFEPWDVRFPEVI